MPPKDLRRPLILLAVGGFVSGMSMRVADPMLPKLAQDFGVTVGAAAVIITSFTLAYGLFQLLHGPLGDRFGKLRAVSVALMAAAVASAACSFAHSLAVLTWMRFLTGMTAGAVIPLSFAFVGDNVPYERRQMVLGQFISGTLLGQTFGPLLGGVFSDTIGWRATFIVLAVAFALIGAVLIPQAKAAPTLPRTLGRRNPFVQYATLLKRSRVRTILLAVAVEGFLFFGAFPYFGAYLKHAFALTYTTIGLILAGFGLGGVGYSLLVRTLVLRLGEGGLAGVGGVLLLLGFGAIAAATDWIVIVPLVVSLGFSFYMLHNTLQTRATEMAPEARGSAVSLFAFCLFLGQAAGVSTVGVAIEWLGYRPVIGLTGVALIALAFWLRARLVHA